MLVLRSRRAALALLLAGAFMSAGCKKSGLFFQSVNPPAGRPGGGEEVRIRGSGFRALGGLQIRIGPKEARNVGIADDETIVLTTPECRDADQGHPLDIHILTHEGRSVILRGAFTYRRNPGESNSPNSELQRRL
ncbi:MAG: IPT/TIG domain-containing protein [Polyangiales bacterium]